MARAMAGLRLFIVSAIVWRATVASAASLSTTVTRSQLDAAAYAQWVDGTEVRITTNGGPTATMWTTTSKPGPSGQIFGNSPNSGPRHLRVGFTTAVPAGTVLARGGGRLSVLKTSAAYPGNLADDSQWIGAQRMITTATNDGAADEGYAVWVLPPGTSTRALRFTHEAMPQDSTYSALLGGVLVLAERFNNIAPQATMVPSVSDGAGDGRLNNSVDDEFGSWDNGAALGPVISPTNAPWIILHWPTPVTLRGLATFWRGFASADFQAYIGPDTQHPREAPDSAWSTVGSMAGLAAQYPRLFDPDLVEFPTNVTTRAVRVRMTQALSESNIHPHLVGSTFGGTRVWLGEIMALWPLGTNAIETSLVAPADSLHPPIPIPFTLAEASVVTLVIEDTNGVRVRNLVSETAFPAGSNVVWWDGLDESGRVNEGLHGVYEVQGRLVSPGTYRARGLTRQPLELRYEFTVNNAGRPPWYIGDGTGRWLADHTPPSDVLFLPGASPQVVMCSTVAEMGDGMIWTDLTGRKTRGKRWVGGDWTGASHLARDQGPQAGTNAAFYSGSVWEGALRLYAFDANGNARQVAPYTFTPTNSAGLSGLAAYNGLLVCAFPQRDELLFVNATSGQILGTQSLTNPRGVAFDSQGQLLALSSNTLLRFTVSTAPLSLSAPAVLVSAGLINPQRVAADGSNTFYVSDWGDHQVKVFDQGGALLRTIGAAGELVAGPFDETKMHSPLGLTLCTNGELWVAEDDYAPKRISVWSATNGSFVRAFYGPPQYGGGGVLDPVDSSRFYYHDHAGMEFQLDWTNGTSRLVNIYHRPGSNDLVLPYNGPVTPLYLNGVQYMVNSFHNYGVGGEGALGIWIMRDGVARPAAAFGNAAEWTLLRSNLFQPFVPAGANLTNATSAVLFAWADLNDDGQVQTNEVQFASERAGFVNVNAALEIVTSAARTFAPVGFATNGAPIYDLRRGITQATGFFQEALGDHSGLVGHSTNGWTYTTGGPMQGFLGGRAIWSYPNQWPSLQASHSGPLEWSPGLLVGTTRLLAPPIIPGGGSDAGEIFAVNGNMGQIYLFTTDGLFVGTLFRYSRTTPAWGMPQPTRGMMLNDVSLGEECFWPSITQCSNGAVYVSAGHAHSSLVRAAGLETIRRFTLPEIQVTTNLLDACIAYQHAIEAQRITNAGRDSISIEISQAAPAFNSSLAAWANAQWATIDVNARAAVRIAEGRLFAAFQTEAVSPYTNAGGSVPLLFKTGGGFDLMLGTDAAADVTRTAAAPGDVRLLVSRRGSGVAATLYRPRIAGGSTNPVAFSSPWRTIYFDAVEDVSAAVTLTNSGTNWQLSVPVSILGLNVRVGDVILGDVGVLRGSGGQTYQRSYWHNKATGLTADIPGEAELAPDLWGRWIFTGTNAPPTAPIVWLASPREGALCLAPTNIGLVAAVSSVEAVQAVDFIAGSTRLGSVAGAPFAFTWTNPPPGYHAISAVATAGNGIMSTSPVVHVAVAMGVPGRSIIIETNSVWSYSDKGQDLSNSWWAAGFNDAGWSNGPSPLGYGDANGLWPRTTNSYGPSATNKYITTYYRRAFLVGDRSQFTGLTARYQRDDGLVAYLNDAEVFRSNMPTGALSFTTWSSQIVSGAAEDDWFTNSIPLSALRDGTNVLAVEVHQRGPTSSDLWFELQLYASSTFVAPVITEQPMDVTADPGAEVTFAASAIGSEPLFYQWQFNGGTLTNATNAALTLTNTQPAQAGDYSVIVTNAYGTATSAVARLMVVVPPTITQQPTNRTAVAGRTAFFIVNAAGAAPLAYQWQFNGTNLPSRTNALLLMTSVQRAQTGGYQALVTNRFGAVTSRVAVLMVVEPPRILVQPTNQTTVVGGTATFQVVADDGGAPLSYQWLHNGEESQGTNATLAVTNVTLDASGSYQAIVTNIAGAATSAVAQLIIVLPGPVIAAPVRLTNGSAELGLLGSAGSTCVVEASSNLTQWTTILTNILGAGGSNSFTDPDAATMRQRFYRAKVW